MSELSASLVDHSLVLVLLPLLLYQLVVLLNLASELDPRHSCFLYRSQFSQKLVSILMQLVERLELLSGLLLELDDLVVLVAHELL